MTPRDSVTTGAAAANERALAALLDYIEHERERRRREILEDARSRARGLLCTGLRQARERVREAIAHERRETRSQLQAARAAEDSRLRRRQHEIVRARLDEAWEQLEQRIAQRWADAGGRREWIAMALDEAAVHLPAGTWRLEHPEATDPETEGQVLARAREQRPDVEIDCVANAGITAGVRIRIAHAVLDVTPEALLGRRPRVEGLLLGRLGAGGGLPLHPPADAGRAP